METNKIGTYQYPVLAQEKTHVKLVAILKNQ